MATGAIGKFFERDSFFLMFDRSLIRLVFVARIAGVFDVAAGVAVRAGYFSLTAVIQGKAML